MAHQIRVSIKSLPDGSVNIVRQVGLDGQLPLSAPADEIQFADLAALDATMQEVALDKIRDGMMWLAILKHHRANNSELAKLPQLANLSAVYDEDRQTYGITFRQD